jgi:hypothetical protein
VVANFGGFCPFLDGFFDVVFVDGDHDEQSVARDTQIALEHVRVDGTLVFHDWDMDGVRLGVRSVLGHRKPRCLVGSLASFGAT